MNRIASLFAPVAFSAAIAPLVKAEKNILEPVNRFENKRMCLHLADMVVSPQAPLSMACTKIAAFADLAEDWAGEGAVAPSNEAIKKAVDFLSGLAPNFVAHLNCDDIVPSPYGTISLEWTNKRRDFVCVEVGDDEIGYFYELNGIEETSDNDVLFSQDSASSVIGYLLGDLYEVVDAGTLHTA